MQSYVDNDEPPMSPWPAPASLDWVPYSPEVILAGEATEIGIAPVGLRES